MFDSMQGYLDGAWYLTFLSVFGAGVLTSFTPCVYPMIPITVGIIGAQEKRGKLNAFLLSLVYATGLALTYATLGIVAAMTGQFFGKISANPITLIVVANIIILFALAMMDVFSIPMPAFLRGGSSGPNKGGFIGAFVMGLASGLIMAPCTTPVLGVLLAFVATQQNVVYGALLLLTFAFGMNILLILVGTFTGLVTALPKSGVWMVRVKIAMGLLLLAMGEYFLIQAGKFWL